MFDFSFDVGGFLAGVACTSAVLDVVDMFEHIIAFRIVVADANAVGLWKQRAHSIGASATDAEEDGFFGGDSSEVVDAWAEGGLEDALFAGVGEGAVFGPVGGGHWGG